MKGRDKMYSIKKDILNSGSFSRICSYISKCENEYEERITPVIDKFIADKPALAALAGPSCSGKTTTAGIIISRMREKGMKVKILSTDDFFFNQESAPLNPDGTRNFEHFSHVDSELLLEVLHNIEHKKKVLLPVFDFVTGKRCAEYVPYDPCEDDVVIVEGIHALNDRLVGSLDPELLYGIYISVGEGYYDGNEELFGKYDIRLIRRLIRDKQFRNADAEKTFGLWKNVVEAEFNYIDPFIKNADIKISSVFEYEPSVVKNLAIKTLSEITPDSCYYKTAESLIRKFDEIPAVDTSVVPSDSLLREFIGSDK